MQDLPPQSTAFQDSQHSRFTSTIKFKDSAITQHPQDQRWSSAQFSTHGD